MRLRSAVVARSRASSISPASASSTSAASSGKVVIIPNHNRHSETAPSRLEKELAAAWSVGRTPSWYQRRSIVATVFASGAPLLAVAAMSNTAVTLGSSSAGGATALPSSRFATPAPLK